MLPNAKMEQELESRKKHAIEFFMDKGVLVSPDLISRVSGGFNGEELYDFIKEKLKGDDFIFINSDIMDAANSLGRVDLNWHDMERARVLYEKGLNTKNYVHFIGTLMNSVSQTSEAAAGCAKVSDDAIDKTALKVSFSYEEDTKKKDVQDFVGYFNVRYSSLKRILENRQELQNTTSINRIHGKREKGSVSIIGLVMGKSLTKNGNYVLDVEDPTGCIKVLVNKNKPELYNFVKEMVLDEMIGISGVNGDNIIFANNIIMPDIPLNKEMKKSKDECYAVFLSDLHVGSKNFLPDSFNKFLSWINQEVGNDAQKDVASKVGYIFIIGDLVDGVGVYPDQDSDLDIKDIYEQYNECARFLSKIPKRIKMIICPGNHDAMRISEPQPVMYKDFAAALWQLPNTTLVSNPAIINIHSDKDFSGFDVLMYHGYSFDYFVANVDSIREQGGYNRADLIMKFLLQRRHLAPSHSSTLYLPDARKDCLVIDKIPDFFVTGHIHKAAAANYRNVTMICSSCWQSKTAFQEKVGHDPEPSRVPIVNLQTRQVKILRF